MSIEHEATVATSSPPKPEALRVFAKRREMFLATVLPDMDGDTFHAIADISTVLGLSWQGKVRVRKLYCDELSEAGGPAARDAAAHWLNQYSVVALDCHGSDNHGRLLCDVYNQDGQSFAEWMIANGYGTSKLKGST